eukprot:1947317-Rhodomonas_salina.2
MPDGRFSDGWGACDHREKRFAKPNHDVSLRVSDDGVDGWRWWADGGWRCVGRRCRRRQRRGRRTGRAQICSGSATASDEQDTSMRQQAIMSSENELQARDAGAADAPTERSSSSTADR